MKTSTKLVLAFLALGSAGTSPLAVIKMLFILSKVPYWWLRTVVSFLLPGLFSKSIKNDTILITGGAGGIGSLMAQKFAKLGAKKIVLLDLNPDMLKTAQANVERAFVDPARQEVHSVVGDLSKAATAKPAMQDIISKVGDISILINNAGVVTGKKFNECPDHLMELSMRVNAEAHFWTTQAVLPKMIEKNEGHIVSIASSAGICGVPGLADYCASKHAAVGFDESIRLELRSQGKTGVKTTCVQPFFIKTGMFEGAQSRWPRVLPLLDPDYAAEKIVRAIQCDQPVLMMPMILHLMPTLRALLPVQVFDQMADWMGVLDAMHDFKGGMTGTRAHTAVKN